MCTIETSLKKWMLRMCGCGPSDCQKWDVSGDRRAATPLPGLAVLTVHEASDEISLRPGGGNGSSSMSKRTCQQDLRQF